MPSRRPPIVTVWRWARPWVIPTRFSFLVSAQRAGRPSRLATQHTSACSGSAPNLAPNAPPTSRVMTRIASGSIPSMPASALLVPCAPWLGIHAVSRPSASHRAAAARVSIGAGATRWLRMVRETTTSHPSNRSAFSASGSPNVAATLVPAAGKSTAADGPSASAMSTTTGSTS